MVIDSDNRFLTGRVVPRLVRFCAEVDQGTLRLSVDGDHLTVSDDFETVREVVVWKDVLEVADCGDQVAEWLSRHLGRDVRLVFQRDQDRRWLPEGKRVFEADEVSFADGYPLLLIGTASLDALNRSLQRPVAMDRFRPNLVVKTKTPYVEDSWRDIVIGQTPFTVASQCTRCVFTTIDPDTGERDSNGEPLATLLRTRRRQSDLKPVFGVNLVPNSEGRVYEGDAVTVG